MSDDIVERLRSLSILDGWLPMMEEAAVEIDRQRKVISAMIEDCQYLKDKQIEAADEIEKLRAALKPFAETGECESASFSYSYLRADADTIEALRAENARLLAVNNELSVAFKERDEALAENAKLKAEMEELRKSKMGRLAWYKMRDEEERAARGESDE